VDLSAAPGPDPNWGLHGPGANLEYTLNLHAGGYYFDALPSDDTLTTMLQMLAGEYGSVTHGYRWRVAELSGMHSLKPRYAPHGGDQVHAAVKSSARPRQRQRPVAAGPRARARAEAVRRASSAAGLDPGCGFSGS
jgi:hypothetical protein